MAFASEKLNSIYDRTSGYCHICHKKLAFRNYGLIDGRGAWEVEHSNPIAKGGTNGRNNLYPACVRCNRSKGTSSTRSARAKNGKTRAPLSVEKRKEIKTQNAIVGSVAGAAVGSIFFGRSGTLIGALIGAHLGDRMNPDN